WKGRDAWKVYLSTFIRSKSVGLADSFAAEVVEKEQVDPTDEFVYDLTVEDTSNFVDACGGVILHNTDLATMYERAGRIRGKKVSPTGTARCLSSLTGSSRSSSAREPRKTARSSRRSKSAGCCSRPSTRPGLRKSIGRR